MRLPLIVLLLVLTWGVRLSPPPAVPAARPSRPHAPAAALVDERQIILEYSAAGVITVNGETVRRDALSAALRRIYADRRDRTLWLDGAGALRYGDVAEVIEIAKRAGVERVGVMTPEMRRRRTSEKPGAGGKLRDPRGPLLVQLHRAIAQLISLANQLLLPLRVGRFVRLQAEQDVLVGHGLGVVGVQAQRLVLRVDTFLQVLDLFLLGEAMIAEGLLPVEDGEAMVALWVVRLELGGLVQRFHGLREVSLTVIEAGERRVDDRVVRLDALRLEERLLGVLVASGLLVDLGEEEVGGDAAGVQLRVGVDGVLVAIHGLFPVLRLIRDVRVLERLHRFQIAVRVLAAAGG